jgi:hypothetical protein
MLWAKEKELYSNFMPRAVHNSCVVFSVKNLMALAFVGDQDIGFIGQLASEIWESHARLLYTSVS